MNWNANEAIQENRIFLKRNLSIRRKRVLAMATHRRDLLIDAWSDWLNGIIHPSDITYDYTEADIICDLQNTSYEILVNVWTDYRDFCLLYDLAIYQPMSSLFREFLSDL
jgi:hypothetical protein